METSTEPHPNFSTTSNNKAYDIIEEQKQKISQKKQE
jgi:hypothetical protein